MKRIVVTVFCALGLSFLVASLRLSHAIGNDKSSIPLTKSKPLSVSVESSRFRQQARTNFGVEDGLPAGPVHDLAWDQSLYAATERGVARFADGRWKLVANTQASVRRVTVANDKVWFAQGGQIGTLAGDGSSQMVATVPAGTTVTALRASVDTVYVGTANGLFVLNSDKLSPVSAINQLFQASAEIRQIAIHGHEIVVAAREGLATYDSSSKQAALLTPRDSSVGWALHDVRAVDFDAQGILWFAAPQGVGRRTAEGWTLWTGHDGLPYNDFTCLAAGPGKDAWFGTRIGAIHRTMQGWEYRQGRRWLADDHAHAVVVTESGDAWFATDAGITRIESRPTTLRDKSAFFNSEIDRYHRRTPYGYVDAYHLRKAGDKSDGFLLDSDNDGLWTGMYGAAQCFEYAVTGSAESKKRADEAFRAVAFLSEVPQGGQQSPPVGFPARSILPTSGPNPNDHHNAEQDRRHQQHDPQWKILTPRWPISADGKWYWKTDTSSDELDGHYFLYGLYYDLVADTEDRKRECRAVVERISNHLIEHEDALVDHDGWPTRWGRFGPQVLNGDVLTDCRGLNSVSYLSYLIVAEHVTGDSKYRRRANELLYQHHYFTNVLNPKYQNGPGAGNQSDDEMAFMCYYSLLKYETDPQLRQQYQRSFARYFAQEEYEACPLFSFIFAAFYEPVRDHWKSAPRHVVEEGLETLERYPLDRLNWGYHNSHRLDVVPLSRHIPEPEGRGHLRNGKVLPIDERFVNHWNLDPWRLDNRAAGTELCDGTSFLLPFWLGVYHGLIKENDLKQD